MPPKRLSDDYRFPPGPYLNFLLLKLQMAIEQSTLFHHIVRDNKWFI